MSVVWVLANQVWPVIGGLERVAFEQARLLAAKGHTVKYIGGLSRVSMVPQEMHQGVDIRRIQGVSVDFLRDQSISPEQKVASFRATLEALKAEGAPDLVIAHNAHRMKPEGLVTALFETVPEARAVNHLHSLGRGGDSEAILNAPWDAHVAVSHWTAKQARGLGSARPIKVIYPGVDTASFTPEGPKHPEIEAIDGTVVFLPARVDPGKGLTVAVTALARMRQSEPAANFQLVLCRSGLRDVTSTGQTIADQIADLQARAAELGVANAIHFVELNAEAMPSAIRASDIVISPSTADEALCLAGPEAMASGVPVVATPIAGQREAVTTTTGLLVEPGDAEQLADACVTLARNPELRAELVANGFELVQKQFAYQSTAAARTHHRGTAAGALPLFESLAQGVQAENTLSQLG